MSESSLLSLSDNNEIPNNSSLQETVHSKDIPILIRFFTRKSMFTFNFYVFSLMTILKVWLIISKYILYDDIRLYYNSYTDGIQTTLNRWYLGDKFDRLQNTKILVTKEDLQELISNIYTKNRYINSKLLINIKHIDNIPVTKIVVSFYTKPDLNDTSCLLFQKPNNTLMDFEVDLESTNDLHNITNCIMKYNLKNLKELGFYFNYIIKNKIIDKPNNIVFLTYYYKLDYRINIIINWNGIGEKIKYSTNFHYMNVSYGEHSINNAQRFLYFSKDNNNLYFELGSNNKAKIIDYILLIVCIIDMNFVIIVIVIDSIILRKLYRVLKSLNESSNGLLTRSTFYLVTWPIIFMVSDSCYIIAHIYRNNYYVPDQRGNVFSAVIDGLSFILIWNNISYILTTINVFHRLFRLVSNVIPCLTKYMISFSIIFLGISVVGYTYISIVNDQFNNFESTSQILFALMNGDNAFYTFDGMNHKPLAIRIFSKILLFIFIVFSTFIALPGFIAYITKSFTVVDDDNKNQNILHSITQYLKEIDSSNFII